MGSCAFADSVLTAENIFRLFGTANTRPFSSFREVIRGLSDRGEVQFSRLDACTGH